MTTLQGIGIMLGLLLALVLICIAVIWLERKFPSEKYDERQKQARGNAHRVSFTLGMVYYLVILAIMIRQVDQPKIVEPYLLLFMGILLQVMTVHIYCILTHAALPLSEKPGLAVGSYLLCAICHLLSNDFTKPMPFVGRGSERWVWLAGMISFFALAIMHGISLMRREKE